MRAVRRAGATHANSATLPVATATRRLIRATPIDRLAGAEHFGVTSVSLSGWDKTLAGECIDDFVLTSTTGGTTCRRRNDCSCC
jgi:hypothetical protein